MRFVKRGLAGLLILLSSAACGDGARAPATVANETPEARPSGVNLAFIDEAVRPQDDFYQYANGAWLNAAEIPPDKNSIGVWQDVNAQIQSQLRAIAEDTGSVGAERGSIEQKVGDFYASFMDKARIEELSATPLASDLTMIDAIGSRKELVRQFARLARADVSTPVQFDVGTDPNNAERHVFFLMQSGLGLPNRDYYLGDDATYREIREQAYPGYIRHLLNAAGVADAAEKAAAITALERDLATAQRSRADSRDPAKRYNRYDVGSLDEKLPGLEWNALLEEAGASAEIYIIIVQPDYVQTLSRMLADVPIETWKAYLTFKLIDARAPYLSSAFANEYFDFHRRILQGREELSPRWERGVDLLNAMIGDGLSQIWVKRNFPPELKRKLEDYVAVFINAFHQGIDELDWMSAATKEHAHAKLDKLRIKIGYPDRWPDYSLLIIDRGDLVGNVARARVFAADMALQKLNERPADIEYWALPPQTVVAYAVPSRNEIYFLAGTLLPPYFMPDADPAANYGALSMLIGHEVSHLFDDSGRQYDGDGQLTDWWTEDDAAAFRRRADKLVKQFNEYAPLEGVHINGRQTLGENIADLSGLSIAYRAYKITLADEEAPVIDGVTGDQRFFLARAQTFRSKMTDQRMRQWLATRPHSPARYRVNGVYANVQEFYDAFDVKSGDGMYLPPGERVRIW